MAGKTDTLRRLIQSLKEPEINQIVNQWNVGSGEKTNEYKLFTFLSDKANQFKNDEQLARLILGKKGNIKTYRVVRRQLYLKVLNHLRVNGENPSFHERIFTQFEEAEILVGRGLINESYKVLEDIAETSRNHEYPLYELMATQTSIGLLQITQGDKYLDLADKHASSLKILGKQVHRGTQLYLYYYQATMFAQHSMIIRKNEEWDQINQLLNELEQVEVTSDFTSRMKLHYHRALYWLWFLKGEYDNAYENINQVYLICKKGYLEDKVDPSEMFNVYMDHIGACISARKWKVTDKVLAEFSEFRKKDYPTEVNFLGVELYYISHQHHLQGDIDISRPAHQQLITYYQDNKENESLASPLKVIAALQIARLYLENQDYEHALKYSTQLVSVKSTTSMRAEIIVFAKLIHLMILFEDALNYMKGKVKFKHLLFQTSAQQFYNNTRQLKRKYGGNYKLEELFYRFFINLKPEMKIEDFSMNCTKLVDQIIKLKTEKGNEYVPILLGNIDLVAWGEKQIRQAESEMRSPQL